MRGNYNRPSELLRLLKETGKSYWDLIGRPLYDEGKDSESVIEDDPLKKADLMAAIDYALSLSLDKPEYNKGKDKVTYVAQDSGLSYGSYYDFPTGDVMLDAQKLPEFQDGKDSKKSRFQEAVSGPNKKEVDATIDQLIGYGMSPIHVAGVVGNFAQESLFDPNAKGVGGFTGIAQMSPDMVKEVKRAYGKVNTKTINSFIYDSMSLNEKISKEWRAYMKQNGGYYSNTYKTPGDAAVAFGKVFERPNEKYANWDQRSLSSQHAHDYIMKRYPKFQKKNTKVKKFDSGDDIVYDNPNVPINIQYVPKDSIVVNPETGGVVTDNGVEGGIMLPEVSVVANKPTAAQRLGSYMKKAPAADIDKVMLGTLALGTLPMAALSLPSLAPGSAFWANPITLETFKSTIGALGVDAITKATTGTTPEEFAESHGVPSLFSPMFNPGGYMTSGGIKMLANATKSHNFVPTPESNLAGIEYAYSRNPELANIGTFEEYKDYINSIFPESKARNIYYHMGPKRLLELKPSTGEVFNTNPEARGIYVTPDRAYAERIRKYTTDRLEKPSIWTYIKRNVTPGAWIEPNNKFTDIYPVLIDTKSPLYTSGTWTWGIKDKKYQALMNKYDGIINSGPRRIQNTYSMPEIIVPKTEQTLILGSNADATGFRNFVSKNKLQKRK